MPTTANTMPVPISAAALTQENHVTLMRGPETKLSW
jgi:hypothetical protein